MVLQLEFLLEIETTSRTTEKQAGRAADIAKVKANILETRVELEPLKTKVLKLKEEIESIEADMGKEVAEKSSSF